MKVIFSRKGLDSSVEGGGGRSPLLPDGTLLSIPIPESVDVEGISYADISAGKYGTYADVMTALGLNASRKPHLDPDVDADARPRGSKWVGLFGQANAAQAHLRNEGVGSGDLIMLFGAFQRVVMKDSRLAWTGPRFQAIWGYLQIEDLWNLTACQTAPAWAREHPHVHHGDQYNGSIVYTAAKKLSIPGTTRADLPGFGRLQWHDDLRLTAAGASPSVWQLPASMWPANSTPTLTYHQSATRWVRDGDAVRLRTVGRGQEFVMPSTKPVNQWLLGIIERGSQLPLRA